MKREYDIGYIGEFPDDGVRIIEVNGVSIGVYHQGEQFFAVRNLCPHNLAPICLGRISGTFLPSRQGEWIYSMDGYVLSCIAHGWEFDIRTGESVMMVDRRRLLTYPVAVDGDRVLLTMRVATSAEDVTEVDGGDN
jgi:nitrite reductase/ring-hydroxylating ferredoxin subunit